MSRRWHNRFRHTRTTDAGSRILCALDTGPKTLSQLAIGVYGADDLGTRRMVSWNLQKYRDFVVPLGRKTWSLARARAAHATAEAAE